MTEQAFVRRRKTFWTDFELLVNGSRREIGLHAADFPRRFREITQDLNIARAHGFDPAIIEKLNHLVLEGNQLLYGQHGWSPGYPAEFILRVFPQKVRSRWRGLGAMFLLFYGLAFFFGLLSVRFPDLVYELISESEAELLEEMYDPSSNHFLVPRDVSSDADMFGYYIYNNISIAFRTFAGGILAGIGSLFLLCVNAVFFGTVAGHIINCGFGSTFFPFIVAHGSFELTAILLSAQGGLILGYRLFVTGGLSRTASLRRAGRDALPLITGSALLLVIAAAVEAFWSSRHTLPLPLRLGTGAACWVLLAVYFLFAGRDGSCRGVSRDR
ncbi:MAG: stage II sporulation protein M [Treponema sp.]|jgi:uncharacterized membrane protein SpoIIM required for sporulation|nr:stage II sporulation protein M [Treponema sp.]